VSVLISALIVWTLFQKAGVFLIDLVEESGLGALVDSGKSPGWYPRQARFDLATIVIGTLIVSGISIVVAAPLGLGAAIYLSEYAEQARAPCPEADPRGLAGIPSVVFGFFALRFLGPDLIQPLFGTRTPTNLLVTGVAIGILVTPLMAVDRGGLAPLRARRVARGERRHRRTQEHDGAEDRRPRRRLGHHRRADHLGVPRDRRDDGRGAGVRRPRPGAANDRPHRPRPDR
jgi:hypothetical protein